MKNSIIYIFIISILGTTSIGCSCEGKQYAADLTFGLGNLVESTGTATLSTGIITQLFNFTSEIINLSYLAADCDSQRTAIPSEASTSIFYRTAEGSYEQVTEIYDAETEESLTSDGMLQRSVGQIAVGENDIFTGYSIAVEFAGEYRINQFADATELIAEQNEDNNGSEDFLRVAEIQEGNNGTLYIDASIEKYPHLKIWDGPGTPPLKIIVR